MLQTSGWVIQDVKNANVHAAPGVAIREFPLKEGHGFADYLLYVNGRAAGVVEAKPVGTTLAGVEIQTEKYADGVPDDLPAPVRPLPFLYQATGVETYFTNRLDPDARSRRVFSFHRPETLDAWLGAETFPGSPLPSTLRGRLRQLPPLEGGNLWKIQTDTVRNLENSLARNKPRSLIQMATGSGKTFTAIASAYRLVRHANATRVLFLVDRANLGRQAFKEFQAYEVPGTGRKFTELYNVQLLTSNKIDPVARVVITTVQRLYSMLRGDQEEDPAVEEGSLFDTSSGLVERPVEVEYDPDLPPEFFDVIFVDECHRSIYTVWRQVLEYFDAFLIGLTATPGKQTFGFFHQNLVSEYSHAQAVADGVNVDFDVYRILTDTTAHGGIIEKGLWVDKRDRLTRLERLYQLEDDLPYTAEELDRKVVVADQLRLVFQTFKEKLPTEIFPARSEVPKTLVYAKDDSHADDIVRTVREVFDKGNDFCQKITYRTTGAKPEDLIQAFRNSFNPRIVVTVDMIATGTDIKPLEIVMFLRAVKSRTFFEQMKGRAVRVISPADLKAVSGEEARAKDRFVIVDCVGVCDTELSDTFSLDREPGEDISKVFAGLESLLKKVSFGAEGEEIASTLAGKLARLDRKLSDPQRAAIQEAADGKTLKDLSANIVNALDPKVQLAAARSALGLRENEAPPAEALAKAKESLLRDAFRPLAANPALRAKIVDIKRTVEQTLDRVSQDTLLEAGYSLDAKERARTLVNNFTDFIREHKDEITALQVLYSRPRGERLTYEDVKALAEAIEAPPRRWTPEKLWNAYDTLERDRVHGAGQQRLLTDVVSLVRFAMKQDEVLEPFVDHVEEHFEEWINGQEARGRKFTPEQRLWLELMRDHIAGNLSIERDDFDRVPFSQKGGLGRASVVFGKDLTAVMQELNGVLAD
jgi:type I restriction enzyme R subunit